MSTNGYFARSTLCSGVTSVDLGCYSSTVGTRTSVVPCACARVPASRPIPSNAHNTTPPTDTTAQTNAQFRNFIFAHPDQDHHCAFAYPACILPAALRHLIT